VKNTGKSGQNHQQLAKNTEPHHSTYAGIERKPLNVTFNLPDPKSIHTKGTIVLRNCSKTIAKIIFGSNPPHPQQPHSHY
jgi:hypothetical protein